MLDAGLAEFDLTQFLETAAQKTCAAKIPVAAVAYKYGHADLLRLWLRFMDRFSCWSQMLNDTLDWSKDSSHRQGTFFLSEAARRKRPDESPLEWVFREGLEWGMDTLEAWMLELKLLASDLECPDVLEYLHHRAGILSERKAALIRGSRDLAKLRSVLDGR